jgi:hypothetical protein
MAPGTPTGFTANDYQGGIKPDMQQLQAPDDNADTAVLATRECVRRPARDLDGSGHRLYQVSLSDDDLLLIQACSRWICRLRPAPDVCARFIHLEQQLALAQPASPTSHPGQGPA